MEYVRCVCVWLGAAWVDEKLGFGLYQCRGNMESVGRVFGLRWVVDRGLGPGSG